MELKKEENGMIMIEAIYVVVTTIMIIFLTANFAVLFHNRVVLTSVANETASAIAEVYGGVSKEPRYAYTSPSYFAGRNIYRYQYHGEIKDVAVKKGKWYGNYLLYENEFAKKEENGGNLFDDLDVQCVKNELGLWTIVVSIKKTYPVFINAPSSFMGLDLEYSVEAKGTAICYDVIHQMNSMSLKKELQDKIDSKSYILSGIDNVLSMMNTIVNALQK